MNDLQSALKQLNCCVSISPQWPRRSLTSGEAQALLDERDMLRRTLEDVLETFQYLYTHGDYLKQRNFKNIPAVRHGLAVIGKVRNKEVQP